MGRVHCLPPQYNWTQETQKRNIANRETIKQEKNKIKLKWCTYSRLLAVIDSSIYDDTTYTILTNSLLSNHRVIRWPLVDQVLLVPSKTLNWIFLSGWKISDISENHEFRLVLYELRPVEAWCLVNSAAAGSQIYMFTKALKRWSNRTLIDCRIHSNRFSRLRALIFSSKFGT